MVLLHPPWWCFLMFFFVFVLYFLESKSYSRLLCKTHTHTHKERQRERDNQGTSFLSYTSTTRMERKTLKEKYLEDEQQQKKEKHSHEIQTRDKTFNNHIRLWALYLSRIQIKVVRFKVCLACVESEQVRNTDVHFVPTHPSTESHQKINNHNRKSITILSFW